MLSPPIIALDDVSVGYDPASPVLNRVTLRIDTDDRIALLGANGNGKSTLVKLLAGRLPPFSGHITRAEKLSIGYFAQHQLDELNLDASPYDHVRRLMPDAPETKVRGRVRAIGFSGKAGDTLVRACRAARCRGCCWGLRLSRPEDDHPRRADQPSRHRQPRRFGRGDQRVSRCRDHGVA